MITSFSEVYGKEISDSARESYFEILRYYSDEHIQKAGFRCMEELEFFPRPAQILKYIDQKETSRHNKELIDRFTCLSCRQKVSCIISDSDRGECLDCAGLAKFTESKPAPKIEKSDCRIEGRRVCGECKTIGLCIQEPKGDGPWLCRECYTGMSLKEIKERYRELSGIIGSKVKDPEPISEQEKYEKLLQQIEDIS